MLVLECSSTCAGLEPSDPARRGYSGIYPSFQPAPFPTEQQQLSSVAVVFWELREHVWCAACTSTFPFILHGPSTCRGWLLAFLFFFLIYFFPWFSCRSCSRDISPGSSSGETQQQGESRVTLLHQLTRAKNAAFPLACQRIIFF